ncbi:hypothetical protein ElyMa_003454200, partial [Elysia marginata]
MTTARKKGHLLQENFSLAKLRRAKARFETRTSQSELRVSTKRPGRHRAAKLGIPTRPTECKIIQTLSSNT